MNMIVKQEFKVLKQTIALKDQLLDSLSDDNLTFGLPGDNPSLGALCQEMGVVQQAYINSFRTFRLDLNAGQTAENKHKSVAAVRAWYAELDAALYEVLEDLSDADIQSKTIARPGFEVPVRVQLHIFREALLIFYAKVSVYLRAMGKPLPGDWPRWIG